MKIMDCVKFIRCPIWLHSMSSNANPSSKLTESTFATHKFIRGVTVRRKPLIECPGWLECSETGVGSLCWWWVYTKLTSSTYNVRSATIKPCRVLSFLITCICMLKNLTPCKLWFLTSCKVSNDVYIPKKPQQQQEKWLFPHPNESIYAYRDGKNYDRVNWQFPSLLPLPPTTPITF